MDIDNISTVLDFIESLTDTKFPEILLDWQAKADILVLPDIFGVRITANSQSDRDYWTNQIALKLADTVGGASVTIGDGYWFDGDKLVIEPSYLVEANCTKPWEVFTKVAPTINAWMLDTKQESAWLRFNNTVVLAPQRAIAHMYTTVKTKQGDGGTI